MSSGASASNKRKRSASQKTKVPAVVAEEVKSTPEAEIEGEAPPSTQQDQKKAPKPKEPKKLTLLYLSKIGPSLTKQKKAKEAKFNLRSIDDFISNPEISIQQFLSLLHFIDQPSLIVKDFEFRQDIPYAVSQDGLVKAMKLTKEVKACRESIAPEVLSNLQVLQSRFSNDRWKLPAHDKAEILDAQSRGNGSVRVILTKTYLETFMDQRAKSEALSAGGTPKKTAEIKFLGAYYRYEPVFDVLFDDEDVSPPKRRKTSPKSEEGSESVSQQQPGDKEKEKEPEDIDEDVSADVEEITEEW